MRAAIFRSAHSRFRYLRESLFPASKLSPVRGHSERPGIVRITRLFDSLHIDGQIQMLAGSLNSDFRVYAIGTVDPIGFDKGVIAQEPITVGIYDDRPVGL